ncbi:PIN domain-containing protein [Thermococcus henrietii]|uniref:PIN domain-containing protein n=1 Tax=Thermococcus henrietii TaxID=2016361 RepID=UPI000C077D7A|nr:PIN domain-containing protein [Thermococcus henrietii]
MEVVLDYNVVFSALYNRGVAYKLFMLNHVTRDVEFLVPGYFWEEVERKKDRLARLTRLTEGDFEFILRIIKSQTITMPEHIVKAGIEEALSLSPDPKDAPYVALALALSLPLVTGDLKLKNAIKDRIAVYSPSELLKLMGGPV